MAAPWQWVFSIIGLVAFIMATLTFTQMIWNRPRLVIGYEVKMIDEAKFLMCNIWNAPTTNPILKALYNPIINDLFVEFEILSRIDKHKIGNTFEAMIRLKRGQASERVTLPISYRQASFPIVAFDKNINKAFIVDTSKKQPIILDGAFIAKVNVYFADKTKLSAVEFLASNKPPYIALGNKLTKHDLY